jgi:hypothetical protein
MERSVLGLISGTSTVQYLSGENEETSVMIAGLWANI